VKILTPAVALFASIGLAWPASASSITPMFNVVDLGSNYQLQADSTGTTYSVTGANGGPAYAFDKSPTTSIDVRYTSTGLLDLLPALGQWSYNTDIHAGGYIEGTLQNGSLIQGIFADEVSGSGGITPHVPIGFYLMGTWHNEETSPVSDMNSHGEIVGTSVIENTWDHVLGTYAAFSNPTGGTHDPNNIANSLVADNLNNYIASSLGINLTQGLKVDDVGRIIAQGTVDGQTHDFLLIPAGLSSPMPAPEPSTLVLLAVASLGWTVRRRSRRRGVVVGGASSRGLDAPGSRSR
jgi:PEP-CTERM motif